MKYLVFSLTLSLPFLAHAKNESVFAKLEDKLHAGSYQGVTKKGESCTVLVQTTDDSYIVKSSKSGKASGSFSITSEDRIVGTWETMPRGSEWTSATRYGEPLFTEEKIAVGSLNAKEIHQGLVIATSENGISVETQKIGNGGASVFKCFLRN